MTESNDAEKRKARERAVEAFLAAMTKEELAAFLGAEQMSRIGFDTPETTSSAERVRQSTLTAFWPIYKTMGSDLALQRMVFGLYQVAQQPAKRTEVVVKAIRDRVETLTRDI